MKTQIFALSLIAASALATAAPVPLPPELPAVGQDNPLPVPRITQKTLANGLQVWVLEKHGIPRVDFVLAVQGAGYGADSPDAPGRAKLLASLLTEGTSTKSSKQIAEAAQALGGEIGATACNDGLSLTANALASQAAPMSRLLAEVDRLREDANPRCGCYTLKSEPAPQGDSNGWGACATPEKHRA